MRTRFAVLTAAVVSAAAIAATGASSASANATGYYPCASAFLDPGQTPAVGGFGLGMGQVVDVRVANNNVLPLALTVKDIPSGETQTSYILPGTVHVFQNFNKFGAEPVGWNFAFNTPADSVLALATFRSYFCGRETGPVHNGLAGKCLDDYHSGTKDGNKVDIWTCNGTGAQSWTWGYTNNNGWDRTIRVFGKCLRGGTSVGAKVDLYTCTGASRQQWESQADGTLKNVATGLCLTDPNAGPDGTQLQVWTCNSQTQQQWTLPVFTPLLN